MDFFLKTYIDVYETIMPRATLVFDYTITNPGNIEIAYADTAGPDDYADWILICDLDQNGSPRWEVDVDCGEGRQRVKPFQMEAIIAAVDNLNPRIRARTEGQLFRQAQGADR